MTLAVQTWVYDRSRPRCASHKAVLALLAHHANTAGFAWPGMALLQRRTGLSRATIWRAVKEAEERGEVRRRCRRRHATTVEFVAWKAEHAARPGAIQPLGGQARPPSRRRRVGSRGRDAERTTPPPRVARRADGAVFLQGTGWVAPYRAPGTG